MAATEDELNELRKPRRCTPCLNKQHRQHCDPVTEWCECPCNSGEREHEGVLEDQQPPKPQE